MIEELTWVRPEEIEARSMEIIGEEMAKGEWTEEELLVVKRCIHTAADFDYGKNLYFSPGVMTQSISFLKKGVTFVTDTNMAASGINKQALNQSGSTVRCFMADEDVAKEAKSRGVTRAIVSMERAIAIEGPVVFVIGNAPTALIRLFELIEQGMIHPVLIIGAPVGFVNVVESKELICQTKIPCIVPKGRKGGSNIAAAICNALLYQAVGRGNEEGNR